jgi:hypothetical protein
LGINSGETNLYEFLNDSYPNGINEPFTTFYEAYSQWITLVELRKIALACLQIYQVIYGYIHLICGDLKAILWRELTQIGLPI